MNEEENRVQYFLRVNEVVNMIRGLGEAPKNDVVVKVLIFFLRDSMLKSYPSKR